MVRHQFLIKQLLAPLKSNMIAITIVTLLLQILHIAGDDYSINPDNKSLLIAAGCFWCAEQAFEQYAAGVVEAVSGYAGAGGIDYPTYGNHPGHYEVILIEYDPDKASYKLMVEYAYRNIDVFDGSGQFCDRGFSYFPAIFFANDEERIIAEQVRDEILQEYPSWDADSIAVPLLERPKFWTAEDYHQDYYIKKPKNYGYYKEACGRTKRLKQVWGDEQYYCYHDFNLAKNCFNGTVLNEEGEEVEAEVNVKNAPEEVAGLMPTWAVAVVSALAAILGCGMLLSCAFKYSRRKDDGQEEIPHKEVEED